MSQHFQKIRNKSLILKNVCIHRRTVWKIGSHAKYVFLIKYREYHQHYYYYYYYYYYNDTLIRWLIFCQVDEQKGGKTVISDIYDHYIDIAVKTEACLILYQNFKNNCLAIEIEISLIPD